MPAKNLVQVASWIKPTLKKQAEKKLANGVRMSMSSYIEHLIRKDLEQKGTAA